MPYFAKKKTLQVAVGILCRQDGSVMLAARPQGKMFAGYWEFPGGKIEAHETPYAALVREFQEELGIAITQAALWLRREHRYEHANVCLWFFRVSAWQGEPAPLEGQQLAWQFPGNYSVSPMLPANQAILTLLELPTCYQIMALGTQQELPKLSSPTENPAPFLLLCHHGSLPEEWGNALKHVAQAWPHSVVIWALESGQANILENGLVNGVHLTETQLLAKRERPNVKWVGASASNPAGIQRAASLNLDYVILMQDKEFTQPKPLSDSEKAHCLSVIGCPSLPLYDWDGHFQNRQSLINWDSCCEIK